MPEAASRRARIERRQARVADARRASCRAACARGLRAVRRVDDVDDERNRRDRCRPSSCPKESFEPSFVSPRRLASGLRAQHQVREIDVPRMRRHVRAFGLVAKITEIALVDDLRVVGLRDAVDFHRRGLVDEIEQRRECVAQADAAPAAVADVEDAVQFLVDRVLVVELGIFPVERVARRGVETAFAERRWFRSPFGLRSLKSRSTLPLSRVRERVG